ncbi:MAG: hypothetical protein WBK46_16610 [Ruminococcus flavefaciens]
MKKYHKLFLFIGIFLIFSFIAAGAAMVVFAQTYRDPYVGIIGGADTPTILILWSHFRLPVIILAAELLAGIGCIIASAIMKKKK